MSDDEAAEMLEAAKAIKATDPFFSSMAPPPEPEQPAAAPIDPTAMLAALAARAATDEQALEWEWKNETIPRLKECGFESRYWRKNINWHPEQADVFRECWKTCKVRTGAIIALVGIRGTGKTTICAQMARGKAESAGLPPWERTPPYRKLQDLVSQYKPLYAEFGSVELDSLMSGRDSFCQRSLTFIDEIHEVSDSNLGKRILTDILDRRYAGRRDTILISNQTAKDFERTIGDSVKSRLSEHGRIIECNWQSFRDNP